MQRLLVEGGHTMMRLTRRASLLVVFSLLTSVATAYAECTWIAWRQIVGREGVQGERQQHEYVEPWAMLDTAPTQAQCQTRVKAHAVQQAILASPNKDKEIRDAMQGRENMVVFLLTKDRKIMATEDGANISFRRLFDDGLPVGFNYLCAPDTVDPRGPKGK